MKLQSKSISLWLLSLFSLLAFVAAGCAPAVKGRHSKAKMDTPKYHNETGERNLVNGNYDDAKRSFNKALELDPKSSFAKSGLAVSKAHQTNVPHVSDQTKKDVLRAGEKLLDQAVDEAKNDAELARAHRYGLRFYVVLGHPEDWYDKAKDHYEDAAKLEPNEPSNHFFMASAEAQMSNYDAAKGLYNKVLKIDGAYGDEAAKEVERIHKIERALPSSKFGKEIANVGKITRADAAALLLIELKLDRMFSSQQKQYSAAFAPPETMRAFKRSPAQNMPEATDLRGNPLADSIELVLSLGLKGLEADASHKFYPSESLTRAEFALVLQSILAKVTQDDTLATKYIGTGSPHPDVKAEHWSYNAVRVAVERGLMKVTDLGSSSFDPMGAVSGADALLSISQLKRLIR